MIQMGKVLLIGIIIHLLSLIQAVELFVNQISWFPRSKSSSFLTNEFEITYPYIPIGPLHSLSSFYTGKIYTLGTVATEGPLSIYSPSTTFDDSLPFLGWENINVSNVQTKLYPSFYSTESYGLSWKKSMNSFPSSNLRWLSTAILAETGILYNNNSISNTNETNHIPIPTCQLICIIGGLISLNKENFSPSNRVDCTNDEGESWFAGPPLPFTVIRGSALQISNDTIIFMGGTRSSISTPYQPVIITETNCVNYIQNDTSLSINIWEIRIKFINDGQCTLDNDNGWLPWNQSTPANNRDDMIMSMVWNSTDDYLHGINNFRSDKALNKSLLSLSNNNVIPLPKLLVGSGDIPGKYSLPLFDLWVTKTKIPFERTNHTWELSWSRSTGQIPSKIPEEFKRNIIHEPIRLFMDLRDGNGKPILPGRPTLPIPDHVIIYMEANRAYISSDEGNSFSTVFHRQYPNFGTKEGTAMETLDRSLRRLSIARDPSRNFEPILIGWSLDGQLWRGDFVSCNDTCPTNHWSSGCRYDPYDAICSSCSVCNPGYYTALECAYNGRYMDTYCMPCSECTDGMVIKIPCSSVQNTVCEPPISNVMIIIPTNVIFSSYVTVLTLGIVIFITGFGIHLLNRKKSNIDGKWNLYSENTLLMFFRTMLGWWPCFGTILSVVFHITSLWVISWNAVFYKVFVTLCILYTIGLCLNIISILYFISYFSFWGQNNQNWLDKLLTLIIGILSIGHPRVLLCHKALQVSVNSLIGIRNIKNNLPHPTNEENLTSDNHKIVAGGSSGTIFEWHTTQSMDETLPPNTFTSKQFSKSVGLHILENHYRFILWSILLSTVITELPFIFPLFILSTFRIPSELIVFLSISLIIDIINIISTVISFSKRLDRINLIHKLTKQGTITETMTTVMDTKNDNDFHHPQQQQLQNNYDNRTGFTNVPENHNNLSTIGTNNDKPLKKNVNVLYNNYRITANPVGGLVLPAIDVSINNTVSNGPVSTYVANVVNTHAIYPVPNDTTNNIWTVASSDERMNNNKYSSSVPRYLENVQELSTTTKVPMGIHPENSREIYSNSSKNIVQSQNNEGSNNDINEIDHKVENQFHENQMRQENQTIYAPDKALQWLRASFPTVTSMNAGDGEERSVTSSQDEDLDDRVRRCMVLASGIPLDSTDTNSLNFVSGKNNDDPNIPTG